jgi:hypothetical protein
MNKFAALALAAAVVTGTMSGAMAATKSTKTTHTTKHAATHFYVAKSSSSNKCEIVTAKPNGKSLTMVGKYFYKSKTDATHAMHRYKSCTA